MKAPKQRKGSPAERSCGKHILKVALEPFCFNECHIAIKQYGIKVVPRIFFRPLIGRKFFIA